MKYSESRLPKSHKNLLSQIEDSFPLMPSLVRNKDLYAQSSFNWEGNGSLWADKKKVKTIDREYQSYAEAMGSASAEEKRFLQRRKQVDAMMKKQKPLLIRLVRDTKHKRGYHNETLCCQYLINDHFV